MSSEHDNPGDWMGPWDCLLDFECELAIAAHIVTPRWAYAHHGIYVGEGRVIHYGGFSCGLRRSPIEEVSLSEFAQGRPIALRLAGSYRFDRDEVVRRARRRLGEDRYHVFANNCEHFCEWCVRGEHRSYQVDQRLANCADGWRRVIERLVRPNRHLGLHLNNIG